VTIGIFIEKQIELRRFFFRARDQQKGEEPSKCPWNHIIISKGHCYFFSGFLSTAD
jgi:hypothetical protein